MIHLEYMLLFFLIICAILAHLCKHLLHCVLMFAAFSTVVTILWLLMQAPDLAITEAAVGVGIDTILFLMTLKNVHFLDGTRDKK